MSYNAIASNRQKGEAGSVMFLWGGLNLKRRSFLKLASLSLGCAGLASCSGRASSWLFFNEEEAEAMKALCDQIIPPDEDPGGVEAGTVCFIDRQLATVYAAHAATYHQGLASLNQDAIRQHGAPYCRLDQTLQREMLIEIEKGGFPSEIWKGLDARKFFRLAIDHAMQGYYGCSRHGGNHGIAGYRLVGIDFPPIRSRVANPNGKAL